MGRHTKMLSLQQGEKPHKREMRPHYINSPKKIREPFLRTLRSLEHRSSNMFSTARSSNTRTQLEPFMAKLRFLHAVLISDFDLGTVKPIDGETYEESNGVWTTGLNEHCVIPSSACNATNAFSRCFYYHYNEHILFLPSIISTRK